MSSEKGVQETIKPDTRYLVTYSGNIKKAIKQIRYASRHRMCEQKPTPECPTAGNYKTTCPIAAFLLIVSYIRLQAYDTRATD